jgi:hypothetical protein
MYQLKCAADAILQGTFMPGIKFGFQNCQMTRELCLRQHAVGGETTVVLMEVSLLFLYHKFATASHAAILLRKPSPLCVCVCVCVCLCLCVCVCVCVCMCMCEHACACG